MVGIKEIIKILLDIIEKVGPTVATLSAVYLAYIYAKKQKLLENKSEEYKRIRIVTSHLIQIWREFSLIEFYTSSDDIYADLIFVDPDLASSYFNIDFNRVDSYRTLIEEHKEEIKSINVALFYNIEHSFMEFKKSLNIIDFNKRYDANAEVDFKQTLNDLFSGIVRELEEIIVNTSEFLPKRERKEIGEIIEFHHEDLKEIKIDFEVPNFFIRLLNNSLNPIEPITNDEINYVISDSVIKLLIAKFYPIFKKLYIKDNPMDTIYSAIMLITNASEDGIPISGDELLLSFKLSDSDNQLFQNNLAFYKMVCAIYKKFDNEIPWDFKRILISVNNGDMNLKKEIENERNKILTTPNHNCNASA